MELAVVVDVAPGQIEEPVTAIAVRGGAFEVETSLRTCGNGDVELPVSGAGVCRDELFGVLADLDTDPDIVIRLTAGSQKVRPGRS